MNDIGWLLVGLGGYLLIGVVAVILGVHRDYRRAEEGLDPLVMDDGGFMLLIVLGWPMVGFVCLCDRGWARLEKRASTLRARAALRRKYLTEAERTMRLMDQFGPDAYGAKPSAGCAACSASDPCESHVLDYIARQRAERMREQLHA